jgi:hypothetical protein
VAVRWNAPGIPHTDWTYLYEDDLGDRSGSCGMCGTRIRYVITVIHDDYGVLGVGRKCAIRLTTEKPDNSAAV